MTSTRTVPQTGDVAWHRIIQDRTGLLGPDPHTGRRLGTKKRAFAHTPVATSDLLAALIDVHPAATIHSIRAHVHYDPELTNILDDYIHHGWGHLPARSVFRTNPNDTPRTIPLIPKAS